jgi:glycosyltransferase involved in cell wall biosynthesis
MKIACVVHRYGADIAGGSETHCRHVAERLAARHDVTVLTTCARDHVTWGNDLPPGVSHEGAVTVRRFPVARQRSMQRFSEICDRVFLGRPSREDQEEWFRQNGPDCPDLLRYLETEGSTYDRVVFWAFRYATSFFGLPLIAERAVLVPTAEDDPIIRLDVLATFFSQPSAFIFLTPEERALVTRRAMRPLEPSTVVGSGLEPAGPPPAVPFDRLGIRKPFVLYLGRIDPNKGCEILIRHFRRYHAEHVVPLQLVLAGPPNMPMPDHPAMLPLGRVDETLRQALLSEAFLLVVPSPYESLSLVLLEGWNHGLPALVNGHCDVLKGQALRADGALYYRTYDEFARGIDFLLEHPHLAQQLGRQGLAYVEREYRWPGVMAKIEALLAGLGRQRAVV